MEKQFDDLLKLYKDFIEIFDNWQRKDLQSNVDFIYLTRVYQNLTDLLLSNGIITTYGIKNYKVVESGEII